jgi:hypothetical protein
MKTNVLGGSAIGTISNDYLDVIPFFNKIGYIYASISSSGNYMAARSDAVKLDNSYMDYTNGSDHNRENAIKLLMPQYRRRVEVEDLNKNFWVISTVLDATAEALWGNNGIVDIIRNLISEIVDLKSNLGISEVKNIELLHEGSNELYFDMYTRFNLNGLSLKLKSDIGDREIKNIFY